MSKTLLESKSVIPVNTELATLIGLDKAIVLQQIHYWLQRSSNYIDDKYWVYNTMSDWHKQFPYISLRKLKSIFKALESEGFILTSDRYNTDKRVRTKWYSIEYGAVAALSHQPDIDDTTNQVGSISPQVPPPKITHVPSIEVVAEEKEKCVHNLHYAKCKTCTLHCAKNALSSIRQRLQYIDYREDTGGKISFSHKFTDDQFEFLQECEKMSSEILGLPYRFSKKELSASVEVFSLYSVSELREKANLLFELIQVAVDKGNTFWMSRIVTPSELLRTTATKALIASVRRIKTDEDKERERLISLGQSTHMAKKDYSSFIDDPKEIEYV